MAPKVREVGSHVKTPKSSRPTGAARRIRKLKVQHPEFSDSDIARIVGCNSSNVSRVLKRFLGELNEGDVQTFQQRKADMYDALQVRMLGSITDADILKTPVGTRVISAGVLYDKAALTRGQATQINVNVLLDAVQAIREMRKGNTNTAETIDLVHNDACE
jgi:hypothetical protein